MSVGTTVRDKIKSVEELAAVLEPLRASGKRIVQCHGVFDLLHIGHIRYLEEARKQGDILVVTLTTDSHVNRGPHRPAFTESLRAEALANLECVDFVAVSRWPTAIESIRMLRPHFYAKGAEYRDASKDITGKIGEEQQAVEDVGGTIVFTDGITFSSTNLINRHMDLLAPKTQEYLQDFSRRHPLDEVRDYLQRAQGLRVLLVGEAILDEYIYCDAIGKSSKEPTLVVKRVASEMFAGGILAAANHVAGFCDQVSVLAQIGDTDTHETFIREHLEANVTPFYFRRPKSPTIVKRRIIENYFFQKLIEVYEINDARMTPEEDASVAKLLRQHLASYDVVIVIDYGHGMLGPGAVEVLQSQSRWLAVNAQSNAGNMGYQLITKYQKPDLMTATENEARLDARDRHGDIHAIAQEIARRSRCGQLLVTRGKNGCLCLSEKEGMFEIPAVASKIVDRVGAGDAFLSAAALCSAQGAPIEVSGFVGNAAGALAVATVGNKKPIGRVALFKQIESLLK